MSQRNANLGKMNCYRENEVEWINPTSILYTVIALYIIAIFNTEVWVMIVIFTLKFILEILILDKGKTFISLLPLKYLQ